MDSESQTNINSIGQIGEPSSQPWESFMETSTPINEDINWGTNQELDTKPLISSQENITWNRYELKPKKERKLLYFLLWVLTGILLCLCYSVLLNNNWISNSISDTINSLSNKMGTLSNTVNNVVVDKSKLSWTYSTDNSQYVIDFNKDWTLRWTEKFIWWGIFGDQTSFFAWTYKYENNVYILYVEWWMMAMNTVFTATPQPDWSLRIVWWSVHNELFKKRS